MTGLFHGTTTNPTVTGTLSCPAGSVFSQGGFSTSSNTAHLAKSAPANGGAQWTVSAQFAKAAKTNTVTISGVCVA